MLGRLLKRQIQPSLVYTSQGYVDSLGRVGRFFEGNWAGAYVDQNTALGIPAETDAVMNTDTTYL